MNFEFFLSKVVQVNIFQCTLIQMLFFIGPQLEESYLKIIENEGE